MKTYNLRAAAYTEAHRKALQAIKSKIRDDGRRISDFRISDLCTAATELLHEHPEIIERATRDVERRRSKLTSGAQKLRR